MTMSVRNIQKNLFTFAEDSEKNQVSSSRNANAVAWDPAKSVFLAVFPSQRAPLDNKNLHSFASSLTSAFGFFQFNSWD